MNTKDRLGVEVSERFFFVQYDAIYFFDRFRNMETWKVKRRTHTQTKISTLVVYIV